MAVVIMSISNLSERQRNLLRVVVREYIERAEPVGSQNLVAKYELGVSPATVRNEMVHLIGEGLLKKPHSSAGRVPTTIGFRFYINELLEEEDLPVIEEVSIKQRLWPQRFERAKLFREASRALADSAHSLALVLVGGALYYAGAANILENPEFFDIDVTRTALRLLDKSELVSELFSKLVADQGVNTLIGSELGVRNLISCGVVFSNFDSSSGRGAVGVLGPNRMDYAKIFPRVRYIAGLLDELGREW